MNLQEAWAKEILLQPELKIYYTLDNDNGEADKFDLALPFSIEDVEVFQDDDEIIITGLVVQEATGTSTGVYISTGALRWETYEKLLKLGASLERKHPGLFKAPANEQ